VHFWMARNGSNLFIHTFFTDQKMKYKVVKNKPFFLSYTDLFYPSLLVWRVIVAPDYTQ